MTTQPTQARRRKSNHSRGIIASEFVNRTNPVLKEDMFVEPMKMGSILSSSSGDYVRFFDESDSMLTTLNAVANASPTTRSIIRQKARLIVGDGLNLMQGRGGALFAALSKGSAAVTDEAVLTLIDDLLSSVNADGDNIIEILERAVFDYLTFGNAYIGVSVEGKEVYLHHIPFSHGRLKRKAENEDVSYVGINNEPEKGFWTREKVTDIALFPEFSEHDGTTRSVIHLKEYAAGCEYYGLPQSISSLLYAQIEYRIAKYNDSSFDNSLMPSGVLQFFGSMTQKEAEKVIKDFQGKYLGTGKNGGVLVQVIRDESLKANFVPIERNMDGEFQELARLAAQAIVTSHGWTMSLAGFATKGQLGTNEQIRMEFEIVTNSIVKPLQNMICRKVINPVLGILTEYHRELKGKYIEISNLTPVSFLGSLNVDNILTNDEKRQIAGYEPLSNGSNNNTDPNPAQ